MQGPPARHGLPGTPARQYQDSKTKRDGVGCDVRKIRRGNRDFGAQFLVKPGPFFRYFLSFSDAYVPFVITEFLF